MLERGSAAKLALSVFYENFNDIDIYVEDTAEGYDKIFSRLLGRALNGQINIDRVFPLGERDKVIAEAQASLSRTSDRASVHIVDGDLYLLCGEHKPLPPNLIVLPRYCIENFLFDQDSLLALLDEEDVSRDKDELSQKLDYSSWIQSAAQILRPLFIIFAVSHRLNSGIKTVKNGSKSICKDGFGNIDQGKADALYSEIYLDLCVRYGICVVEMHIQEIAMRIAPGICFATKYVSGKDFILPLLFVRLRNITESKAKYINLKIRLANKCDIRGLDEITDKIKKVRETQAVIANQLALQ